MELSGSNMSRVRSRGCSLGMSRGRPKAGQSRRAWTNREEEVLVVAMKGLLVNGWKSDNGFRGGYLAKLEEAMKEALPGSDIKGDPHIHSKLTIWKRMYVSLAGALARSGVGFNERTFMLDCDDDTWNLVVKADKNAAKMRFKSFPLYPAWTEMFGKDRANGTGAEDVMDAFANLLREDERGNSTIGGDYVVNLDNFVDEGEAQSVCGEEAPESSSKAGKRKRKATDEIKDLTDLIRDLVSNTSKMEDMAKFIGYEFGLGQKREMVFSILSSIPAIDESERFELADILVKDSDRLELFNALPDDSKEPYLRHLLNRAR